MAQSKRVRRKVVWGPRGKLAGLLVILLASMSCGELVREGKASSYLIIDSLLASSGAEEEFSNVLASDVVTEGGVVEDPGQVIMRLGLKDPGTSTTPNAPTSNNFITVTRYRVEYRRADGRNVPGVDVPYSFDGAVSFTVGAATVTAGFTLVRVQAKLEPPLLTLRTLPGGGALVISTLADVTFFGRDQTGQEVSVTGTISVNFANWADPD